MRLWKDNSGNNASTTSPSVMPGGNAGVAPAVSDSLTGGSNLMNRGEVGSAPVMPVTTTPAFSAGGAPSGFAGGGADTAGNAARWQIEESRFERRLAESEFADALNRLADFQNPYMRAGGAARVAALATRRLETGPGEEKLPVGEACPFFVRASAHMTAALHMEEEPAVRDEIRKALDGMIDFAASLTWDGSAFSDDAQFLLYAVLDDLADANRSAKRAFQIVLARYLSRTSSAGEINYETLRPLVGFTAFCPDEELTFRCLCDIANELECRTAFQVQATLGFAQSMRRTAVTGGNRSEDTFESLWHHSERMKESANALAACLRALPAPPAHVLSGDVTALEGWRRSGRKVNLWSAFLPAARLARTHLAGAILAEANLHGALLENINLSGANMSGARLNGANIQNAILLTDGGSGTLRADLHRANWWTADAASWRGSKGEALQQYLAARFPRPSAPTPPPAPTGGETPAGTAEGAPAAVKAATSAEPAKTAPARTARSLFRKPGALDGAGDVQVRDSGMPDEEATVDEGDLQQVADVMEDRAQARRPALDTVSTDTVMVRESGLPKRQKVSDSDLMGVQDLMTDRAPVSFERGNSSVQIRESGKPTRNGKVTDSDLTGVQDLMKDR